MVRTLHTIAHERAPETNSELKTLTSVAEESEHKGTEDSGQESRNNNSVNQRKLGARNYQLKKHTVMI